MGHTQDRLDLETDLDRLRRMLARTAAPAAAGLPIGEKPDISILNVACGACDEARTLSDFFARLKSGDSGPPASTLLVGTDVRDRELDQARGLFRPSPAGDFEFIHGDASKLSQHKELPKDFDVVFFRHQNLYHGRQLWKRIFEQGLAKLSEDGLLIITSYFDREHELAIKAFQEIGAELVTTARNHESRELATPGKSVDRHVAVLRHRKG